MQEQNRRILGSSLANQMLLFNHKLTAEQAATSGFVSEVQSSQMLLLDVQNQDLVGAQK